MKKTIILPVVIATLLSGCDHQPGQKETIGAIGGGALGALAGSQIGHGRGSVAGGVVGGLLGAFLGSQVGQSMDRQDHMQAERSAHNTFENSPDYQPATWRNPNTGHHGSVTTNRTYRKDGRHCRDFTQTVNVGGRLEEAHGVACRNKDGSWVIVS